VLSLCSVLQHYYLRLYIFAKIVNIVTDISESRYYMLPIITSQLDTRHLLGLNITSIELLYRNIFIFIIYRDTLEKILLIKASLYLIDRRNLALSFS
jgi:hypothetical protein